MNNPVRILLVENEEVFEQLVFHKLKDGGFEPQIDRVSLREDMAKALDSREYDIVLADHRMPKFSAPEALELLNEKRKNIPFVIISGQIDEKHAVAMMACGAKDYVHKDNISRLVPVVERELRYAASRKEHEFAEKCNLLFIDILRLLNMSDKQEFVIQEFLRMIKSFTGVDAAGIRLREGEAFPYYAVDGFPDEFCMSDELSDGNESGNNGMNCLVCDNVIAGITDKNDSCYTEKGSFWINNAEKDTDNNKESFGVMRDICRKYGYRSMALIPLESYGNVIGLLQLSAKAEDMFTLDMVHFLEKVAASIGIAFERAKSEERTQSNYALYKVLNLLLQISLKEISLEQQLREVLEIIISASFMKVKPEGRIYLSENNKLILKAYKPGEDNSDSSCKEIPFGRGLCGIAAETQTIQFLHGSDIKCPNSCCDNKNQFYCCVPIVLNKQTLGVVTLYLRDRRSPELDMREAGFLYSIASTLAGIIERKRIDNILKKALTEWQNTVDSVKDLIFLLDANGRIIRANLATADFLKVNVRQIIGKQCGDLFHDSDNEDHECLLAKMKKTKRHEEVEFYLYNNNKWFWSSVDPIFNESGEIAGAVHIMRDITERKEFEGKIIDSQKMDSIGNLAAGVAHDINNILSGILGYASLLILQEEDGNKTSKLKDIVASTENAAELVAKLLAFGRRGKNIIVAVNLNEIIFYVCSILEHSVDKSIKIDTVLHNDLYSIDGDPAQITQVAMNICVNAAEAIRGPGTITIQTQNKVFDDDWCAAHPKAKKGAYVLLSVTDTGAGMDRATQSKIFEPFFTTKTDGEVKGTGLGLATVYGIVVNHGGFVDVYSEVNQGTTIKVYLPAGEKQKHAIKGGYERKVIKGSGTVLLVDDEEAVRKMTCALLENLGYNVITAVDGADAVKIYAERHREIDGVVLDMIMPNMGGKEAFIKMKEINPGINAALSTGYARDGRAQEILDLGVKEFIQKPFNITSLSQVMIKIVKK